MITLSAIKQLLLTVSIPRIVVPSESSSYKDKTMATISNCYTYFFFWRRDCLRDAISKVRFYGPRCVCCSETV